VNPAEDLIIRRPAEPFCDAVANFSNAWATLFGVVFPGLVGELGMREN
jgi:hypothetical protein